MQKRTLYLLATILMITWLLEGCGSKSAAKKDADVPSEAITNPSFSASSSHTSKEDLAALTIQVFQEDSNAGVAAEIERLDDTGVAHHVADVDDSGIAKLTQPCIGGDRFAAKPRVDAFLRIAPQTCAATITFRLYSAKTTYALIHKADDATRTGDLLAAQTNYGLAAERLRYAEPEEASHLTALASTAAGRVLGVHKPTIRIDGQAVPTDEMIERLKVYQRAAKISESGELDAATREAISKVPLEQVLQEAHTAAIDVPARNKPFASAVKATEIQTVTLSPTAKVQAVEIQRNIRNTGMQR